MINKTLFAVGALSLASYSMNFAEEAKTVEPFNGKDLNDWAFKVDPNKARWVVGLPSVDESNPKAFVAEAGEGAMINFVYDHGQSVDIFSKQKFGSGRIEVELMVPKDANSGVYVMGEYEVQILDSFGKTELGSGDMGAVYGAAPPPVNACKAPGEWQKYVIDYIAPKYDDAGNKVENFKFVKIELNGQVLHENLELPAVTPGGVSGMEAAEGPIMFQGDHGAVALRNIKFTPLAEESE